MKQKKVHKLNILILTINTDGLQPISYSKFEYFEDVSMFTDAFIINY